MSEYALKLTNSLTLPGIDLPVLEGFTFEFWMKPYTTLPLSFKVISIPSANHPFSLSIDQPNFISLVIGKDGTLTPIVATLTFNSETFANLDWMYFSVGYTKNSNKILGVSKNKVAIITIS